MKSFIKTLSIALGSAVLSIFIYDFYFQPASEEIIKGNVGASLIPANYTYNSGNVAAELTDFTVAAEKTVHAVVHVKNTSSSSSDLPAFYRKLLGPSLLVALLYVPLVMYLILDRQFRSFFLQN